MLSLLIKILVYIPSSKYNSILRHKHIQHKYSFVICSTGAEFYTIHI